jgi:hypothetical protein
MVIETHPDLGRERRNRMEAHPLCPAVRAAGGRRRRAVGSWWAIVHRMRPATAIGDLVQTLNNLMLAIATVASVLGRRVP